MVMESCVNVAHIPAVIGSLTSSADCREERPKIYTCTSYGNATRGEYYVQYKFSLTHTHTDNTHRSAVTELKWWTSRGTSTPGSRPTSAVSRSYVDRLWSGSINLTKKKINKHRPISIYWLSCHKTTAWSTLLQSGVHENWSQVSSVN